MEVVPALFNLLQYSNTIVSMIIYDKKCFSPYISSVVVPLGIRTLVTLFSNSDLLFLIGHSSCIVRQYCLFYSMSGMVYFCDTTKPN
jgi:hypothetical protein